MDKQLIGWVTAESIHNQSKVLLLGTGIELTPSLINLLRKHNVFYLRCHPPQIPKGHVKKKHGFERVLSYPSWGWRR